MSIKICKILVIISFNLIFEKIFCETIENKTEQTNIRIIETRVVGGYRPETHTLAKYIVSIRYANEGKHLFGYTHFCAGSIIEANKILTAAHCVSRFGKVQPAALFKIVAKTPKRLVRTAHTQEIKVKKIICHRKFSEVTFFNDIALLILAGDIDLDSNYADTLYLPEKNIEPDRLCTIIGWGKFYMHGPMANDVAYADLHLHSRKYCRKKLPKIGSKKICASNTENMLIDACMGDSGGPLICGRVVTGIVSYGYGCASGHPGVYTNVYKFLNWIVYENAWTWKPLNHLLCLSLILSMYTV